MPLDSVKIERVKVKDLPATAVRFIDNAPPGAFIPITKHRAEALAHNPYADPDDIALLLATENGRCVGYFGAMPVMLQHEGNLHKVHWLTTWAVSRDYLGKGLGSRLMEEALALDVDLTIVGSKPARRVSANYGFHEVKPLEYVQVDFGVAGRYNPIGLLLRAVRRLFDLWGLRFSIKGVDDFFEEVFELAFGWVFRPILYWSLISRVGEVADPIRMSEIISLKPVTKTIGFVRDERALNWMLTYPWVLSSPPASANLKYEFTNWRPGFQIAAWRPALGAPEDFAIFQVSRLAGRVVLKVLDHQFEDGKNGFAILALAAHIGHLQGASIIEGPEVLARPLGRSWLARVLVRRKQRILQVHPRSVESPLAKAWPQLEQTYVDGDMAFT